ncbi:MAG TPA: triose-phosphate isomerase [Chloroflexota bacterium]|jgi:triosephosphate isomerase|nr:triose-phosphate isomerase [Chloroflexota bacterium]
MRKPLVVGNWKMNTTQEEAAALVSSLVPALEGLSSELDVVVCPPFPWLVEAARALQGSRVGLGAQNMHTEASGAYTGEVSPRMLKGLCQWVLIGQYERRIYFGDKDAIVRRKLQVAQQHGLRPILCVGENADQLDEGVGLYVVAEQLEANLDGVRLDADLVIAYDPVWTTMGLVAPPPLSYAAEMVDHIRQTLSDLFTPGLGSQARVIYGGSVTPRNIAEIAALETIDGVLAGTTSTNAPNFKLFVQAFATRG